MKALVLFEGLVFSLKVGRYILCDPTDNFATSGTSRIYYSANAEQLDEFAVNFSDYNSDCDCDTDCDSDRDLDQLLAVGKH